MSVNILTEDQAKSIAVASAQEAIRLFIEKTNSDVPKKHQAPEPDQMFTVKQLAEYWQCHEQTIMQKKRKGELPFFQHGRKLFFSKSAIDKLTACPIDSRYARNRA